MTHSDKNSGYEKADINVNKVIIFFVLGIILTVVILIFLFDYFSAVKEEVVYESVLQPQSLELRDLQARETEELTTYKILDADKGIYRIPIERAKKLMADSAYISNNK